ncbi:O1L ortholog [Fowlpox virus]|uniref:O1L ortholog n=1 Tax=Fowlpox virus TaxID=10261 RepID=A0A7G0WWN9_FOWPV|nr:O1L ortholog [Fowlpox virus]
MANLYSKKVRKSIRKFIRSGLNFDLLHEKHGRRLIINNIFVKLPPKYYNFAKGLDLNNILAFDSEIIQLNDLKKLIMRLPLLPDCFTDVISCHKKYLLSDAAIVNKLINSNMVSLSDIRNIIDNRIKTPVEIALLNSSLVIPGTPFSLDEVKYIFENTSAENVKELYKRIETPIHSVLYMEEKFSISPVHSSLYQVTDVDKIIYLIKKYPDDDIIDYVNGIVKSKKDFIESIITIIKDRLPDISPCLNKWISTQLPPDKLRDEFGIYFYALFEWIDIPLYIDKYLFLNITEDETKFICRYIDIYKKKSELFVNTFRWHLYYCNSMYPQKVFPVITYKQDSKEKYVVKESFKYLDNKQTMKVLLNDFKYNYAIGKYILDSSSSNEVKMDALNMLQKQVVCLENAKCFDLGNLYSVLIKFQYHPVDYVMYSDKLLDYMSKNSTFDNNDIGLLTLASFLFSTAKKGIIDINFLNTNSLWSPLMYLIDDSCKVDFTRFMMATKNIKADNINYLKNKDENINNNFEHIDNIDIYKLLDYSRIKLYGINFIKKVILANVIFEYIFTLIIIRYQKTSYNLRSFLEMLLYRCLKGFGISPKLYKNVYVNEMNICCELENLINNYVVPFKTYGILMKLLITIFNNLNGISKHSFRIRVRKSKTLL